MVFYLEPPPPSHNFLHPSLKMNPSSMIALCTAFLVDIVLIAAYVYNRCNGMDSYYGPEAYVIAAYLTVVCIGVIFVYNCWKTGSDSVSFCKPLVLISIFQLTNARVYLMLIIGISGLLHQYPLVYFMNLVADVTILGTALYYTAITRPSTYDGVGGFGFLEVLGICIAIDTFISDTFFENAFLRLVYAPFQITGTWFIYRSWKTGDNCVNIRGKNVLIGFLILVMVTRMLFFLVQAVGGMWYGLQKWELVSVFSDITILSLGLYYTCKSRPELYSWIEIV